MKGLITGSAGLVGSETVKVFAAQGYHIIGIDNDMRAQFFGTSTKAVSDGLMQTLPAQYEHHAVDIRDYKALERIFELHKPFDCIIHSAGQPSHDWSATQPLLDFDVNAVGTLNLLELTRQHSPKANFIFMSTNKVYGDYPNRLELSESATRYHRSGGINENTTLDQCQHSVFGVSKTAADLMTQEYGRYFGINTVVFRAGCITGANHQGAELHGFLSYLVKCLCLDKPYTIYGYKGKQVRDNIHARDLAAAFWAYHQQPSVAAVFNMGGGPSNSLSILEAVAKVSRLMGRPSHSKISYVPENRIGDHIWYVTELSKFRKAYPEWHLTYGIDRILEELVDAYVPQTITCRFKGGLGNQLFQIAMAYGFARRHQARLAFERNQFDGCRQGSHPTTYYETLFAKLTFQDRVTPDLVVKEKEWTHHNPLVSTEIKGAKVLAFDGYWQSDLYFREYRDEIRQLFAPPAGIVQWLDDRNIRTDLFPDILSEDSCFLGVRRGDYIQFPEVHNPCGMTYYNKAMTEMNARRYYVLTDDWAWCRAKFIGAQFVFMDGLSNDLDQFMIARVFKRYIISNSSFYWWAAYLSQHEKVQVVVPDKWITAHPSQAITAENSIYWPGMRIIERPVETQ